MARRYSFGDDFGSLGVDGSGRAHFVGPLIGGGAAQIGLLAAKMLGKGKAPAKWAGLIGTIVGAAAGGALMFSPKYRATGLAAMLTAVLIGVPRQIEDTMGIGLSGYLGVITPEAEMNGPEDVEMMGDGFGSNFLSVA